MNGGTNASLYYVICTLPVLFKKCAGLSDTVLRLTGLLAMKWSVGLQNLPVDCEEIKWQISSREELGVGRGLGQVSGRQLEQVNKHFCV